MLVTEKLVLPALAFAPNVAYWFKTVFAAVTVSGEVVAHTKGPKIDILKYKNKTGYKRRLGHRQRLTQVRVTSIDTGPVTGSAS